ncbi:MAG: hypothetical protein AAF557_22235 [Pseudomonadota bacterium]
MRSLLIPIAATAAFMLGSTASAQNFLHQSSCGKRDEVTQKLERKFGELQRGTGVVSSRRILELWQSNDGSWTILMTRPDGVTCIMAAGEFWRKTPEGTSGDPV